MIQSLVFCHTSLISVPIQKSIGCPFIIELNRPTLVFLKQLNMDLSILNDIAKEYQARLVAARVDHENVFTVISREILCFSNTISTSRCRQSC